MSEEKVILRVNGRLRDYPLKLYPCECEYPCSCVEFEGEHYSSARAVVSALVERLREAEARASSYREVLEKLLVKLEEPANEDGYYFTTRAGLAEIARGLLLLRLSPEETR